MSSYVLLSLPSFRIVSYSVRKIALDDFVSTYVTPDDLEKEILPTIEKALLRSPEISLPGKIYNR